MHALFVALLAFGIHVIQRLFVLLKEVTTGPVASSANNNLKVKGRLNSVLFISFLVDLNPF